MKPLKNIFFSLALSLAVVVIGTVGHLFQATTAEATLPQAVRLPIVMYHHVLQEASQLNDYTISPAELREDFSYLQKNGYTPIFVQDLIQYTQGGQLPEKPIILTFDDGYESFAAYVFPPLERVRVPAVYSIIGAQADFYSQRDEHRVRYSHADWETLQMLQKSGLVEIQNHTYNLHRLEGKKRGAQRQPGENETIYQQRLRQDLGRLQEDCRRHLDEWTPTLLCLAIWLLQQRSSARSQGTRDFLLP